MSDESKITVGDPVFIAVMGATGSGKSTFINLASGSDLRISEGLESCTHAVDVARAFELGGRQVVLIDTPGFDDTSRSDTEILDTIAAFLATSYKKGERLSGIVYIHRISDFRMGGSSSRNFQLFCNLCGDNALKNGVIITNMWGEVDQKKGEAREAELTNKFFNPAIAKGASISRHDNTRETAHEILRNVVDNQPLPLQLQIELIDERKTLLETVTGAELNRELLEATQKQEAEIQKLQEELEEAMRMKDEETRKELEEAKRELQQKVDKMNHDAEHLKSAHSKRHRTPQLKLVDAPQKMERVAEKEPVKLVQQTRDSQSRQEKATQTTASPPRSHHQPGETTAVQTKSQPKQREEAVGFSVAVTAEAKQRKARQATAQSIYSHDKSREITGVQVTSKERELAKASRVTTEFKQQVGTSPQTVTQPILLHDQSREMSGPQVKQKGRDLAPASSGTKDKQQPYQVGQGQENAQQVFRPKPKEHRRLRADHEEWDTLGQEQNNLRQRIEQLEEDKNSPFWKGLHVRANLNQFKDKVGWGSSRSRSGSEESINDAADSRGRLS